ncbi:MAG: diacylglycerol kinase family protein [Thermodesulfobacteriota bacterium]
MIGVVSNPRARKNVTNPNRVERLRQILGREAVFRTTQTPEEISDAAREFRREEIDILVIDGGDGTLHHTLSAFIPIYNGMDLPPIVLLRGGTMNTIANSLGIKGLSEAILQRILSAIKGRVPFEIVRANVLQVNDRYGFIFGLGFPVNLLKAYYRGEGRGKWKSIGVLFKILFSSLKKGGGDSNFFRPFKADIWLNGERLPIGRCTAILGSTVKEVGLGFKPTRRAGEREGFFQILCCEMGPKRMGLTALKILLGMELRDSKLFDRMATRSVITLEKPVDMQMDGEIFRDQKEIRLHVGPAIRFIRTLPSS